MKYERKPELRTLESGITESLESGIHRHRIRNPTVGIRNPRCEIRNPRLAWIPLPGAKRWTSKAHFYGQMMLISVNAKANKRQGKQLFTKRWPVILKTKRTQCKYPDVLPDDGRVENFEYETNSMLICFVA